MADQQQQHTIPPTTIALPGAFASYFDGSGVMQGEGYYGDERDYAAVILRDAYSNAKRRRCGKYTSYEVTVTDALALVILAEYAAMSVECCEYGDVDPTEKRASNSVIDRILATGYVSTSGRFNFAVTTESYKAGAAEAAAVLADVAPELRADFIEHELSDEGREIGRAISEQNPAFNDGWEHALEQARRA